MPQSVTLKIPAIAADLPGDKWTNLITRPSLRFMYD
jgi:hypothetical protein